MTAATTSAELPTTPLTVAELLLYLPKYDPRCDLVIGDWVLITPMRRPALLDPLIAMWEPSRTRRAAFVPPTRYRLAVPLCAAKDAAAQERYELAPLSAARIAFGRRKRPRDKTQRGAQDCNEAVAAMAATTRVLYLHVRLGLLTPSVPDVFGGDGVERRVQALLRRVKGGQTMTALVSLRDGSVERTPPAGQPASAPRRTTPRWAAEVTQEAEVEWAEWQQRERVRWEAPRLSAAVPQKEGAQDTSAPSRGVTPYITAPFPFAD